MHWNNGFPLFCSIFQFRAQTAKALLRQPSQSLSRICMVLLYHNKEGENWQKRMHRFKKCWWKMVKVEKMSFANWFA